MSRTIRSAPAIALLSSLTIACGGGDETPVGDTAAAAPRDSAAVAASAPRRATSVSGFETPESVVWDSAGSVWFVSNINGDPGGKDNNGFISRLRADGSVDSLRFIAGGRGGAPVHAPKGMAIRGNELWVSDIDAVHVFDRTTGRHMAHVDLRANKAAFLNDVAVGPDGTIYVTDSGVRFTASGMEDAGVDQIFRIDGGTRAVSVAMQSDSLGHPNGITWDASGNRFIVVAFGSLSMFTWKPGDAAAATFASGPGQYDGVEIARDGRVLVSSWADSSIWAVSNGTPTRIITGVPSPADIGLDRQGNRLAIPLFAGNRVEIWELGTP
jgi:sugar lactone lactonase YvrE